MIMHCICHSGKVFKDCCERFLTKRDIAKTPEQLMRSRYAAYALGGCGEYLLSTWFPATAKGVSVADLSKKTVEWLDLQVITKSQSGDKATVEFNAYFYDPATAKKDIMHEISIFQRRKGHWYYVGAEVLNTH